MHNFYSVYTSTPADSQPVPQPQQPAVPGISNCSPSVQQINVSATVVSTNAPLMDTQPTQIPGLTPSQPLPFLSHQQEQNQHRIPVELPQPRAATDSIAFSKGMPGKANQPTNELPMNSYRYNMPAPIIPAPPPVQKHRHFEKSFGQIRRFSVQLIWYKQVETLGEHVFYFDNYDGCCDLVWNRRLECYTCEVDLEEGQHFGQLSLADSGLYAVEKFHLPLVFSSGQSNIILKIVPIK